MKWLNESHQCTSFIPEESLLKLSRLQEPESQSLLKVHKISQRELPSLTGDNSQQSIS